jgi:transposase
MTTYATKRVRRKITAREMAERFNVSPRTVRRAVAEERTTYEARADERRAQIIDRHRQGMTGTAIARELNITQALVSIRLREARTAGVDLSPIPIPTPDNAV